MSFLSKEFRKMLQLVTIGMWIKEGDGQSFLRGNAVSRGVGDNEEVEATAILLKP